jgi:ABC-type Fe3+ transport system permease subunit
VRTGVGIWRNCIARLSWQGLAKTLILFLPLLFLALFFFYPLIEIFALSLAPEGKLDLSPFRTLFTDSYYARLLAFTTGQALLSTLLTLLAGMPAAYVFARYEFRGKSLLRALTTVPFVLPTMVVAAAFTALLGPQGHLNRWLMTILGLDAPPIHLQQTLALVLIAHVFYNAAIIVRLVGGFWANLDPRIEEAARVLGAGRWRTFREVTLPLLLPSVIAASLLVFLFCFTSFGVILVLGGPQLATIEVEIYNQAVPFFNLPLAAALSLLQMIFTFTVMAVYTRLQAQAAVPLNLRPAESTQRRATTLGARLVVWGSLGGLLVLLLTPLLALALRSFSLGGTLTLRYYEALFTNPPQFVACRWGNRRLGPAHGPDQRLPSGRTVESAQVSVRSALYAAAGNLSRYAGAGVYCRSRPAPAEPARVAASAACGPHARRFSIRRSQLAACPQGAESALARGSWGAGRLAGADRARDRSAHHRAGPVGRRRLCLHRERRRVWGYASDCAA